VKLQTQRHGERAPQFESLSVYWTIMLTDHCRGRTNTERVYSKLHTGRGLELPTYCLWTLRRPQLVPHAGPSFLTAVLAERGFRGCCGDWSADATCHRAASAHCDLSTRRQWRGRTARANVGRVINPRTKFPCGAAIAYTRLSKPNKKGRPSIGLQAQQAALSAFQGGRRYYSFRRAADACVTFASAEPNSKRRGHLYASLSKCGGPTYQ
jgi:hypothetical protein